MYSFKNIFPGRDLIFIAEIGLNHNGNAALACDMIREAHKSGADAVKFQTFIPENMNSVYSSSLVKYGIEKEASTNERDFFSRFVLSKSEYNEIAALSAQLNIEFFSSPFDIESVDFLEELGVRLYKVASSEVTNHILLKRIADTRKPVIISTGISNKDEISMALELLTKYGTTDIVLMHCVSLYPLPPDSANLSRINSLAAAFHQTMGFSDHTKDSKTSEIAAALGARYFEKHFMLNDVIDCPDKALSLTPGEFKLYTKSVKSIKKILGSGEINYNSAEKEVARLARKSLFAKKAISKGSILSQNDVIAKRPGIGLPVYKLNDIIGKRANTEIPEDYLLRMEYFD
jgi:N,N'-diacetyllegionaminate synthase